MQARPVRHITAGQVRLAFRAWSAVPAAGTGLAPSRLATIPVVLLHALGENSSDWEPVASALAPPWRVYAPDLRGHGDSDWSGPYTVEQLSADLEAFLDALGLRRVALGGHSMGAAPACLFTARNPDRVTRLILEEPVFDSDVSALSGEFTDPPPSWRAALGDIKVPVLLISGGPDSHIGQDRLAEMAGLISDCELLTIEAGHLVHATRPAEFTSAVTTFLGGPAS